MKWTPKHELAARLLAEDRLTNNEIAKEVGVCRRQLQMWLSGRIKNGSKYQFPEFPARVKELREAMIAAIDHAGLCTLHGQLADDIRYADYLERVRRERSEEMSNVPGGATGLLVKSCKRLGREEYLDEYLLDASMLAERRALKDRIAKLRGLIVEKHEHDFSRLTNEQLYAEANRLAEARVRIEAAEVRAGDQPPRLGAPPESS